MVQGQLDFNADKEIHFVVAYNTRTQKWKVDYPTTEAVLPDGQVYENGSWRLDEENETTFALADLTLRLKQVDLKVVEPPRRPVEANVVQIGRRSQKTSQMAAERVLPRTGTKRKKVFDLIKASAETGLCDHEIEGLTGWLHQSASSIRNGLMNDGWIKDSGKRRKTPQGNNAIVWVVA